MKEIWFFLKNEKKKLVNNDHETISYECLLFTRSINWLFSYNSFLSTSKLLLCEQKNTLKK